MKTFSRRNLVSGKVDQRTEGSKREGLPEGELAVDDFELVESDGQLYVILEDNEGFLEVVWEESLGECEDREEPDEDGAAA